MAAEPSAHFIREDVMKKLVALSIAALFAGTSLGVLATEVTRTDEVRPDPSVKREARKAKTKVKRTAKKTKAKTKAAASRAEDRTEAAANRAR
jgi:hypothetical protein